MLKGKVVNRILPLLPSCDKHAMCIDTWGKLSKQSLNVVVLKKTITFVVVNSVRTYESIMGWMLSEVGCCTWYVVVRYCPISRDSVLAHAT